MQGKGKRKVVEHQEATSDEKGPLNVTWTSSEGKEEGSKTAKRPTLVPSPKRHRIEVGS